jgi:hypothetical protein
VYKEEGLRKAPEKAEDAGGDKKLHQNQFLQDCQQTTFPIKKIVNFNSNYMACDSPLFLLAY